MLQNIDQTSFSKYIPDIYQIPDSSQYSWLNILQTSFRHIVHRLIRFIYLLFRVMINPTITWENILWPDDPKYNQLSASLIIYGWCNSITLGAVLCINSLAPGKFEWYFRHVFFKQILVIDGWGMSCEIALIWMSPDFTDDQSTLVQVMAWCRQATSHYLSQCWLRYLSPYGVTRPQWVKVKWSVINADSLIYGISTDPFQMFTEHKIKGPAYEITHYIYNVYHQYSTNWGPLTHMCANS